MDRRALAPGNVKIPDVIGSQEPRRLPRIDVAIDPVVKPYFDPDDKILVWAYPLLQNHSQSPG